MRRELGKKRKRGEVNKMRENLTEKIVKGLIKLEPVEFLGICTIVDVRPSHEDGNPRDFQDIWEELIDKIDGMNRIRKRNLYTLVRAAIKGRK